MAQATAPFLDSTIRLREGIRRRTSEMKTAADAAAVPFSGSNAVYLSARAGADPRTDAYVTAHTMVPRTQSAAVGAHRREAVHRRLAVPEEVAVMLPLSRGPDCLVHRMRTRK
jgi:hypothetical protein